jgi:hypothetical protein
LDNGAVAELAVAQLRQHGLDGDQVAERDVVVVEHVDRRHRRVAEAEVVAGDEDPSPIGVEGGLSAGLVARGVERVVTPAVAATREGEADDGRIGEWADRQVHGGGRMRRLTDVHDIGDIDDEFDRRHGTQLVARSRSRQSWRSPGHKGRCDRFRHLAGRSAGRPGGC